MCRRLRRMIQSNREKHLEPKRQFQHAYVFSSLPFLFSPSLSTPFSLSLLCVGLAIYLPCGHIWPSAYAATPHDTEAEAEGKQHKRRETEHVRQHTTTEDGDGRDKSRCEEGTTPTPHAAPIDPHNPRQQAECESYRMTSTTRILLSTHDRVYRLVSSCSVLARSFLLSRSESDTRLTPHRPPISLSLSLLVQIVSSPLPVVVKNNANQPSSIPSHARFLNSSSFRIGCLRFFHFFRFGFVPSTKGMDPPTTLSYKDRPFTRNNLCTPTTDCVTISEWLLEFKRDRFMVFDFP